ncbi:MAG: sodium ion-translocating decarboxylase subunit beta, partial [Clostridia bacterium]|nr:sodium ion-translocating decarboxylase subunit beta [Clostridia bacterium]
MLQHFEFLWESLAFFVTDAGGWKNLVMLAVGGLLIWLAISKDFEPSLLMPMGLGAIIVNLPFSGAIGQAADGSEGIIDWLFKVGIEASEALPLILFIGIGAMIDFGPLLSNPKMFLFGGAAQFGIFLTVAVATLLGYDFKDAASIGIIGAADGPTAILVANVLQTPLLPAIMVAAYSYMALVP